ncbi:MAG: trypsin-like peptidase domain-containing protein [Anaerolineae bacterium]|nr:trypsin-like peptidase domain-containing protein [Anaerolineae bacterium]
MISKRQHGNKLTILVPVFLVLATLACAAPTLGSSVGQSSAAEPAIIATPQTSIPTPIPEELIAEADAEEQLLINVYQRVNPAVVYIDVSQEDGTSDELLDYASGSGFVIDPEGIIVTNAHVIQDADEVRVTFYDGMVLRAEVLGYDTYADLAVLQVTPPEGITLVAVELGESEDLLVGQRVIAIGNPFGLSGSMSVGIVSAIGRSLPSGEISDTGVFSNPKIIQTDAAINPGNSGGPLVDSHGRVVGVNYAIQSLSGLNTGVGFAIPVDTVKRIVPQIIENGSVEYPYLGISANTQVTLADLALEYDLPVTDGVLIAEVVPGSGADRAGLHGGDEQTVFRGFDVLLGGDIITALDGYPIHNFDELLGYLVSNVSVDQEITVTIIRDGETLDIPVTVGSRED